MLPKSVAWLGLTYTLTVEAAVALKAKFRYNRIRIMNDAVTYLNFVEPKTIQPQNLAIIGHIDDLL